MSNKDLDKHKENKPLEEKPVPTHELLPNEAAKNSYEEALAAAQKQFEFVSQTGDNALISKAAQKVADIKEQERVRVANIGGFGERSVDNTPQSR